MLLPTLSDNILEVSKFTFPKLISGFIKELEKNPLPTSKKSHLPNRPFPKKSCAVLIRHQAQLVGKLFGFLSGVFSGTYRFVGFNNNVLLKSWKMRKETKTQECLPPLKSWKIVASQKSTICASQSTNNTPFLCHATVLSFGGLAPALSANLDHDAAGSWERWHPRQSCRKQNSEWLKSNKQESGPVG